MIIREDRLRYIIKRYEEKLEELMSAGDLHKFSKLIAKELFKMEIDNMPDSDFKQFCIDNFDEITR